MPRLAKSEVRGFERASNKCTLFFEVVDMDKSCVDKVLVKKVAKAPVEETHPGETEEG